MFSSSTSLASDSDILAPPDPWSGWLDDPEQFKKHLRQLPDLSYYLIPSWLPLCYLVTHIAISLCSSCCKSSRGLLRGHCTADSKNGWWVSDSLAYSCESQSKGLGYVSPWVDVDQNQCSTSVSFWECPLQTILVFTLTLSRECSLSLLSSFEFILVCNLTQMPLHRKL